MSDTAEAEVLEIPEMDADADVPDLRRWIDLATFLLPDANSTLTQWTPDNSKEAKNGLRVAHECINGGHGVPPSVRATDKRDAKGELDGADGTGDAEPRRVAGVDPDRGGAHRPRAFGQPAQEPLRALVPGGP